MAETATLRRFVCLGGGWIPAAPDLLPKREEVSDDRPPAVGQDAFRMKLHAPDGMLAMPHSHDLAFLGLGGDLEAVRKRVAFDDQGVVARRHKRIGHPLKQVLAVVFNRRSLAVHHAVIDDDFRAEDVADALMAQANAEKRRGWPEGADDLIRQARFARRTRSRRNQDALRLQLADLVGVI